MGKVKQLKKELTRDERINAEIKKLKTIFKDIQKDKKDTVTSLINNASFMMITLEDLQKDINENGAVSEYKNGENQFGTKKSPEVDIYNTMIKNHMNIIKQLTELLPKDVQKEVDDGFDSFTSG